jgi:hypothetical protein
LALRKKNVVIRSCAQFAHSLNTEFFSYIDTEAKAYWLGFLAADGNVYGSRVQINLAIADLEHLRKFAHAIGSDSPIRPQAKRCVAFAFRSTGMVSDLRALGIYPAKSLTYTPWRSTDSNLQRHFWRGMVDGDGWVVSSTTGYRLGLCGSRATIDEFTSYVYNQLSITLRVAPRGRIWIAENSRKTEVQKIASFLYGTQTISLQRKLEKAQELMAQRVKETEPTGDYPLLVVEGSASGSTDLGQGGLVPQIPEPKSGQS